MIEVQKIFDSAKQIVISQLPIASKPEIIYTAINLGVIELYKIFNLSIKIETIKTTENNRVYTLTATDVSQIISIQNECGRELVKSTIAGDKDYDYRLLAYNKFLLRNPISEELLITYKASPEVITETTEYIDIPTDFMGCLLDYIAYRCHITLNNDNLQEVDTHYNRFLKSVQDLIKQGYQQELAVTWRPIDAKL